MPNVVFYNHYHSGDQHLSRGFIRQIIKKIKMTHPETTFTYTHPNPSNLLADINHLSFNPEIVHTLDHNAGIIQRGDTTFINTWMGQKNRTYLNKYGMTFDAIYTALNDTCQELWEFALSSLSGNPGDFLPIIDYRKFEIKKAKEWLANHPEPKILIENGDAHSGQANNISFLPAITYLAHKFPQKSFILSKKENADFPSNVYNTSDIIQKSTGSDLNEISFLSRYCDVVVGRSSGVVAFCMTQENLLKRSMKFINFTNLTSIHPNKLWLGSLLQDRVEYSATFITKNVSDINQVIETIEEQM